MTFLLYINYFGYIFNCQAFYECQYTAFIYLLMANFVISIFSDNRVMGTKVTRTCRYVNRKFFVCALTMRKKEYVDINDIVLD